VILRFGFAFLGLSLPRFHSNTADEVAVVRVMQLPANQTKQKRNKAEEKLL
jgi:hypothetical protein